LIASEDGFLKFGVITVFSHVFLHLNRIRFGYLRGRVVDFGIDLINLLYFFLVSFELIVIVFVVIVDIFVFVLVVVIVVIKPILRLLFLQLIVNILFGFVFGRKLFLKFLSQEFILLHLQFLHQLIISLLNSFLNFCCKFCLSFLRLVQLLQLNLLFVSLLLE